MPQDAAKLLAAKKAKDDEFYTPYDAIELEMSLHTDFLRGKSITL